MTTTTAEARDRLRAALYRTGRPQYDSRCDTCAHCGPAEASGDAAPDPSVLSRRVHKLVG